MANTELKIRVNSSNSWLKIQNAKRGSTSENADASFLKDGGDLLSRIAAQYHRRAWA